MGTVLLGSPGTADSVGTGGGGGGNVCRVGGRQSMRASMRKRTKMDLCEKFITSLKEREDVDVDEPGFAEGVRDHFKLLPTRYALDVNIQGLDVLNHKRLLEEARGNPESLAFQVRQVEVLMPRAKDTPRASGESPPPTPPSTDAAAANSMEVGVPFSHTNIGCLISYDNHLTNNRFIAFLTSTTCLPG